MAIALAKLGKLLHFTVTVVDPLVKSPDLPEADRLLNSLDFSQLPPASSRYVVVASRGKFDEEAVEQALQTNSHYVALVAKKQRAQEIRHSLELRGESPEKLAEGARAGRARHRGGRAGRDSFKHYGRDRG